MPQVRWSAELRLDRRYIMHRLVRDRSLHVYKSDRAQQTVDFFERVEVINLRRDRIEQWSMLSLRPPTDSGVELAVVLSNTLNKTP